MKIAKKLKEKEEEKQKKKNVEEPEDKKPSAFKKLNSSGGVINIDDHQLANLSN